MAIDLRSEIFRLRADGLSFAAIAGQLGTNKSRVQRELSKTAREAGPGDGGAAGHFSSNGAVHHQVPGDDPEVSAARKQLALEQLETERALARTRRIEADRRVQLLEHPEGQGSGQAMMLMVLEEMRRMREAPAVPPASPPSLTQQLAQWRQIGETMQSFAPPKAPSTAVDLEFKVAMERLNLEERRMSTQLEADMSERREKMSSELRRNEAVAKAIEQFAQVAPGLLQQWLDSQKAPPAQLPAPPSADQPAPRPVVLPPPGDEVSGVCPNCQEPVAISGDQIEQCPRCSSALVVVEGRIRVRLPNGQLWPPLQA